MTPESLDSLAQRAAIGDGRAIAELVERLQHPLYRLALRFFSSPPDAEDATQEILVQVVRGLAGFEGRSKLTTWAYRIASRYLIRAKARAVEASVAGPEPFAAWLDEHLAPEAPHAASAPEHALLAEEVRIACTYGMLLTLSRELRIAYILGDLLELTDQEGAEALELSPEAFRQRVARARAAIRPILAGRCRVVDPAGACSCERQTEASLACGLIPATGPVFTALRRRAPDPHEVEGIPLGRVRRAADQLDFAERLAEVFRREPQFEAPARVAQELRRACPDLLA
jgi:RNA polymerase sigma factor (sigma-70 family)